jgi:hypothetical protein
MPERRGGTAGVDTGRTRRRTAGGDTRRYNLFFGEQILTGFGATAAGFGADAAMFHLRAVLLAFGAATFAGFDAGAQLGARQFEIGAGKTRDDAAGGETHVRAIDAIADATDVFGDVLLAETGVGAGVAGFRARVTSGDAFDINGVVR